MREIIPKDEAGAWDRGVGPEEEGNGVLVMGVCWKGEVGRGDGRGWRQTCGIGLDY